MSFNQGSFSTVNMGNPLQYRMSANPSVLMSCSVLRVRICIAKCLTKSSTWVWFEVMLGTE